MVFNSNLQDEIALATPLNEGTVLLPTVSVKVHAGRRSANIRGIVAWVSQFNLISEKCRKQFNLPLIGGGVPSIHAVGGTANEILGRSRIKFSPHCDEEHSIVLEVFVTEKINLTVSSDRLHPMVRVSLSEFELADPFFDEPGDVDLLMGVTLCPLLLKDGRHIIPGTSCYAIESIFGWIVMGRAPLENCDIEQDSQQSYLRMD